MKRFYQFASTLAVLLLVLGGAQRVTAADPSSGRVSIESTSVAAGVGVEWGQGTFTYNGKTYPFSLQGLDVVGVGYAKVKAEGEVSNLTNVSDFEGVYAAAEVGAAAGSGPGTVTMKNRHGATITLHAVEKGVQLTLAAGGVNVALKG